MTPLFAAGPFGTFGTLNDAQSKLVAQFVRGADVHDLGAGCCELSLRLLELGAAHVLAVDKGFSPAIESMTQIAEGRLTLRSDPDFVLTRRDGINVALVSWPVTHNVKVHLACKRARIVIYLSKNTDGTACGYRLLHEHLQGRELLAYVPQPDNVLAVYGPARVNRDLVGEECVWDADEFYSYAEVHMKGRKTTKAVACRYDWKVLREASPIEIGDHEFTWFVQFDLADSLWHWSVQSKGSAPETSKTGKSKTRLGARAAVYRAARILEGSKP